MIIKLNIKNENIEELRNIGIDDVKSLVQEGLEHFYKTGNRYKRTIETVAGKRTFYVYKTKNFLHFDIPGIYSVVYLIDDIINVNELPDYLMKKMLSLPVRQFQKVLQEEADAPLQLIDYISCRNEMAAMLA